MRLVRYEFGSGPRCGVLTDQGVVELDWAGPESGGMLGIIGGGPALLERVAETAQRSVARHALDAVRLLAPVERPGKYLGIGLNYKKHIEETASMGLSAPAKQLWFNKQTTCIIGPEDCIVKPGVSDQLDYEVELGVVIGAAAKKATVESARNHIFGYFVANDVTVRDWQMHSQTFTIGKSFDTHGPIGPWIVTADEIADCHALDLRCYVNDELRQSSNTSQMINNVYEQIAYLSTAFTLEPGDLLATGTPEGVGIGMTPPRFLEVGDLVRCEVDGVGVLENKVAPET
jgi:2-keto-4-pentenoate hydratase/2-oxohepta-3-ene-1,7-dioic acid hydratase in catechol pathway